MFDLKAKYKYNAWQKLADDGLSPEEAQERYVKKVEELKGKYGFDENKVRFLQVANRQGGHVRARLVLSGCIRDIVEALVLCGVWQLRHARGDPQKWTSF